MERREQTSVGAGLVAAVLVGLVMWFFTANAGAAEVIALHVGVSVWLQFRWVAWSTPATPTPRWHALCGMGDQHGTRWSRHDQRWEDHTRWHRET